jgi:predicted DNA-binding helix-hairpin-helix protein
LLSDRNTLLTREHRLYQVDFLLRKYHWEESDIAFENDGSLSLAQDPKQRWAELHPEFFPVRLRTADKEALLRVPGLGPQTVKRILEARRSGGIGDLPGLGLRGKRKLQVAKYVDLS